MIDEKIKKQYMDCNGQHCPWCDSIDINMKDTYFDDAGAYGDCECENCGKKWRDIYTLTDMVEQQ